MLDIPPGTVKSRLSTARRHFARDYRKDGLTGADIMKHDKFPTFAPKYTIEKTDKPVFDVVCEEVPGWLAVARVGEEQSFAFYDDPDGHLTGVYTMEAVRNAEIHGIDCVQISVTEEEDDGEINKQELFVRLTESRCMYVADMRIRNGVLKFASFMDDEWLERYEIGENNCGRRTHQTQNKNAVINSDGSISVNQKMTDTEDYDLIGRYTVKINSKAYDTVAMLQVCDGLAVIQYLDANGRTVLWRRFNRFDWKRDRYGEAWTDKLPDSERILINGESYVHWYDCFPKAVI